MRKKTHEEKALSGTIRLDRTGTKRAKVVTTNEVPRPQKYLTRQGKAIYKQIAEHLIKHNSLCKIDSLGLSTAANAFDIYANMAELINHKESEEPGSGYFQIAPNGFTQLSAHINLMNRAKGEVEKACRDYGLTLAARDKIIAFAKDSTDGEKRDPIAEMIENKANRRLKNATNG